VTENQPPPPGSQPPPPGGQPPPPGIQPPPPVHVQLPAPVYVQPVYVQPQAEKKGRSGCLTALLVVGVLAVLGIIAVVVLATLAVESVDNALDDAAAESAELETEESDAAGSSDEVDDAAVESAELETEESDVGGSSDEVDDVGPCTLLDDQTVLLDITNNSSKQSSYIIDVNFLDVAGVRVGDEPFIVNHIRPGERALEPSFAFDTAGGATCEIAEVHRNAAESPDDISEVSCEVTGEDVFGDVATKLIAANSSSKLSDYFIDVALIRDGLRFGTGFASIENVRPGESAPDDGFSTADGPAAGVTCDVVYVQRTASE
jgi:hypothetical protein